MHLIVFDLDGTLIPLDAPSVPPDHVECLDALRRAGHGVAIATGRMVRAALRAAASAGVRGPTICYNGALVVDTTGDPAGRVLHYEPVRPEAAALAARAVRERDDPGLTLFLYDRDELYASRLGPGTDDYFARSGIRANQFDIEKPPRFPSTKLLVTAGAGRGAALDPVEAALRARPDLVATSRSLPHYLEANAPGVSKGSALRHLREAWPGATVIALGDGENDLEMFAAADVSVAMGNAPGPVKAAATHVTRAASAGGIRHALRDLLGLI